MNVVDESSDTQLKAASVQMEVCLLSKPHQIDEFFLYSVKGLICALDLQIIISND